MKLSTPRYTFCLFFQLVFIFCDLIFNCASLFPRSHDGLLVLFIFQDLFLVLSITTMLMMFFSTYLFQAGLAEVVARRVVWCGAPCALYAAGTLALHAATLLRPVGALQATLFTIQRCLSPWYCFLYKRAALRVSDPRFYEDVDWISRQIQTR